MAVPRAIWAAARGLVRHAWGESCPGNMARKRAAGSGRRGREPRGQKAKGESAARREQKEAGESEAEPGLGGDAGGGQGTGSGGGAGSRRLEVEGRGRQAGAAARVLPDVVASPPREERCALSGSPARSDRSSAA